MIKYRKILVSVIAAGMILSSNQLVYADETTEAVTEATTEAIQNDGNTDDTSLGENNEESTTEKDASSPSFNYGNHGGITMTYSEFRSHIEDNKESFQKIDNDELFNMLKNSVDAGEDISLGDAFSNAKGLEIPSNFIYDLSETGMTGHVDGSTLNLQYANLISNMDKDALEMNTDLSSKAIGATEYFNNTYSDVLNGQKIELPSNFDLSDMCQDNLINMLDSYSDYEGDGNFSGIRNGMNISDMYGTAAGGLSKPELMSPESLSGLTSDYNNQLKNNALDAAKASKQDLYDKYMAGLWTLKNHETSDTGKWQDEFLETDPNSDKKNNSHKNPYIPNGSGNNGNNKNNNNNNQNNTGKDKANVKEQLNKQLEKQKLQQNKNEKKQEDKSRKQKMIDGGKDRIKNGPFM